MRRSSTPTWRRRPRRASRSPRWKWTRTTEEDGEPPRRAAVGEEEEDDDDLVDPDDVEADLDTILKDRLVAAEDTPDEDEEEAEPEERGEAGDRLQPKRADEQLCPSCFLLVRRTAPSCPMGDEDCPLFG